MGSLDSVYNYLMGGNEKNGARLFSLEPIDTTRGNGHTLKHVKFHLYTRTNSSTVRVIKHRNWFPREVVESPSLEVFKSCLDTVLGKLL